MNKKERNRYIKSLPYDSIIFKPIQEALESSQPLFDSMVDNWLKNHNNDISSYFDKKKEEIKNNSIIGFVAFSGDQPVGLCWLDAPQPNYGSILLYAPLKEHQAVLAVKMVRSKILAGRTVEIISVFNPSEYIKGFLGMGFKEKYRKRMGLYKEEFLGAGDIPLHVELIPITKEHSEIIGNISYLAHCQRNDVEGYIDYATSQSCINHKKRILDNEFGKFIPKSSLLLKYHEKPVACCISVDINYWGLESMAWIFDIVVLPEYQGYGFGKVLLQQVLKNTFEHNYPMIGLSVTVSNERAKVFYEKTGFVTYEDYHEIISPDVLKGG
ncbi:MAG: GNAT family N-acetyltransferase [Candidatus Margulisiibacteriota bacterium]|jgi:GNAT superfamily N-acetyltransferase